jgi:threonine dehydratase
MADVPTLEMIQNAVKKTDGYIHHTPVLTSATLNHLSGKSLYFKCENFQKGGSFKARGAINAVMSLTTDQASRGVATHSSGNHAAALAIAAAYREIPAFIVMPHNAPEVKKRAVEGYGANIRYCEPTLQAREQTLEEWNRETGASVIHPYNDKRVISGQATATIEFLREIPQLDTLITPVGGGGLQSGTALAASYLSPQTTVHGAEPKQADDAYRSLQAMRLIPSVNPDTIADGLLTSLGTITFAILLKYTRSIILVEENDILYALRLVWERMKIIIEPSAAVPVAAVLKYPNQIPGSHIGIILSGGNIDLDAIPW